MSTWQAYLLVAVATVAGLLIFAGMRRRDTRPELAGCVAIVVPVLMVAAVFGIIILADRA